MENRKTIWPWFAAAILLSLAAFVYFLLFSPFTAKYRAVIRIRDRYVYLLYNIRTHFGLHEADYCWYFKQPINTLRSNGDGTYNYALIGKLVAIDPENNTITLGCSNGKNYKLSVKVTKTGVEDWVTIDAGVNTKALKPRANPFMFYVPDITKSGEKDTYFTDGQLYMAIWRDGRSLAEIYKSIKENSKEVVNSGGDAVDLILRYQYE